MLVVKAFHSTGRPMHELLRRIAIHGGLTALILGVVGVVLADMAASSILTPTGARTPVAQSAEENATVEKSAASLHTTIPLAMAIWGFGFVLAYEVIRHLLCRKKASLTAAPPEPDPTEKLLEELLSQAEAKSALGAPAGETAQPVESAGRSPPR
jgi:hypothetical protein